MEIRQPHPSPCSRTQVEIARTEVEAALPKSEIVCLFPVSSSNVRVSVALRTIATFLYTFSAAMPFNDIVVCQRSPKIVMRHTVVCLSEVRNPGCIAFSLL